MDPNEQFQQNYDQLASQNRQKRRRLNVVIIVLAVLVLASLGGLVFYLVKNVWSDKDQPQQTIVLPPREEEKEVDPNEVDTSGWTKEICSKTTEVCFKAPPDWSFNQDTSQAKLNSTVKPVEVINFINGKEQQVWTLGIYEHDQEIRSCPNDDFLGTYYTSEVRGKESRLSHQLNKEKATPRAEQIVVYSRDRVDKYLLSTRIDSIHFEGENLNVDAKLSRCWMENGPEPLFYNQKAMDIVHNLMFDSLKEAKQAADSDDVKMIYGIMTTARNQYDIPSVDPGNNRPHVNPPYAPAAQI